MKLEYDHIYHRFHCPPLFPSKDWFIFDADISHPYYLLDQRGEYFGLRVPSNGEFDDGIVFDALREFLKYIDVKKSDRRKAVKNCVEGCNKAMNEMFNAISKTFA